MAQTGYTPILLYGSTTASNTPSSSNLITGSSGVELAVNAADGKLFYKDSGGTVQTLATKNAASGTFSSVTITGGTINGTVIGGATPAAGTFTTLTLGTALAVGQGGTGSTTASGARTNLSAAQSGANSDITSLSGLTTALSVAQGGTGVTTSTGTGSNVLSDSPTFTGIPIAPTATGGTSTTQIATTAFVNSAFSSKANSSITISAGTGLSGGGDLTANRTLAIANTGVTAASYGSASAIPVITVNAQGQITAASTAAIYPTSYSLATADGSAASRTVYLTTGTWQVVLDTRAATTDPSNYSFSTTQSGSIGSTTVNTSVAFSRSGGSGYGRTSHGSQLAVGTLTVSTAGNYTLAMAAVALNFGSAYSEGSRITLEKTA